MELVPLLLCLPVLIAAAVTDLRGLRIPNILVLASVGLFVLTCPLLPVSEIAARLLAATAIFAVCFLMFSLRLLGGGDVKLLSTLMLFIPASSLALFGFVFSISMLLSISLLVGARAIFGAGASGYVGLQANGKLPMAVPIAMAGIAHLSVMVLTS